MITTNSCKLKDAKFKKVGIRFYVDLTYEIEDEAIVEEITFTDVELPFNAMECPAMEQSYDSNSIMRSLDGNVKKLCFSQVSMFVKGDVIEKTIKQKTHEMTLEEIEKKLGYKIKIVSEGKQK